MGSGHPFLSRRARYRRRRTDQVGEDSQQVDERAEAASDTGHPHLAAHKSRATSLHIAPVFAASVVQRVADLAGGMRLHRFHQRDEDVLAVTGGFLEGGEA